MKKNRYLNTISFSIVLHYIAYLCMTFRCIRFMGYKNIIPDILSAVFMGIAVILIIRDLSKR